MVLLLDLGNSRLKWGWHNGSQQGACRWDDPGAAWEAAWQAMGRPERIVAVSVAGTSREQMVDDWCRAHWQCSVDYVRTTERCAGVENGYQLPQQLGVDRWAALVGARSHFSGNLLVVDAGTALTVDAVTSQGRHLGGVIAPGLYVSRQALATSAGGLNMEDASGLEGVWGRSTGQCIGIGVRQQAVGLIERSYRALQREADEHVQGVICGGDAPLLLPHLSGCWEHVDGLVLRGAAVLAGISDEGG